MMCMCGLYNTVTSLAKCYLCRQTRCKRQFGTKLLKRYERKNGKTIITQLNYFSQPRLHSTGTLWSKSIRSDFWYVCVQVHPFIVLNDAKKKQEENYPQVTVRDARNACVRSLKNGRYDEDGAVGNNTLFCNFYFRLI